MNIGQENINEKIFDYMGSYHRCCLEDPMHMEYASDNLCNMLGYSAEELDGFIEGTYPCLIHPEDMVAYEAFLRGYKNTERCDNITYRLIGKDGGVIYAAETMASRISEDGKLRGFSVLCDITNAIDNVLVLAGDGRKIAQVKMMGIDEYSIIDMNDYAAKCIGSTHNSRNFAEYIAVNDRERFVDAVRKSAKTGYSGKLLCTLVSEDGSALPAELWIARVSVSEEHGVKLMISFRIKKDTEKSTERRVDYGRRLLQQFAEDVYEVDVQNGTVVCVNKMDYSPFVTPFRIRMNLSDTFAALLSYVVEDDRALVDDYVRRMLAGNHDRDCEEFSRIRFSIMKDGTNYNNVHMTAVPIAKGRLFMCFDYMKMQFPRINSDCVNKVKDITFNLFDSFSIYVDGNIVRIRSSKAKELLALLVVKRGAFVSSREAITALWEDIPSPQSRARYRKTFSRLMEELKEIGIDYIVESDGAHKRIAPEYIKCDYYDYLDGKLDTTKNVLKEYTWSEFLDINSED